MKGRPRYQDERPLFPDGATFADASGSDGLAPILVIRLPAIEPLGSTH
jgi:hypothetical protein